MLYNYFIITYSLTKNNHLPIQNLYMQVETLEVIRLSLYTQLNHVMYQSILIILIINQLIHVTISHEVSVYFTNNKSVYTCNYFV